MRAASLRSASAYSATAAPAARSPTARSLSPARSPLAEFPPGFLELNAPRQRPPLLGNPIFGYSTHPMPPPVIAEPPSPTKSGGGKSTRQTAEAMARLQELQAMLHEERKLRKDLEAELAAARRA